MNSPIRILFGMLIVLLSLLGLVGNVFVKPLKTTLAEYDHLITNCEAKLSRDQFCELVAIPKVKK